MDPTQRPAPFLEVEPGPTPAAPAASASAPWLEESTAAPAEPDAAPAAGQRKKTRAADRAQPSVRDAVSVAIVGALQTERPLLATLWPDLGPAELLQSPPPEQALRARIEFARVAIDAVARKDAESRARAQIAQRALDAHLARLGDGEHLGARALDELRSGQRAEIVAFAKMLSPGAQLVATDLARVDAVARERGVDAAIAREWILASGFTIEALDARPWTPFDALPGAPSTVDAVALAILQHPAQGAEVVRAGSLLAWLRANGATGDLIERSREARMVLERGGAATLAVHQQAWALGRRELLLASAWLRSPGEIAAAVRGGHLGLDDLSRAAREGVLGAWLRTQGWVAAAGAADLAARGDPSGLKRLAWSLGEPLVVGDTGFAEPDAFARALLAREDLRPHALSLLVSGDLLAWMESLPPSLRDEVWIDRLRRGRGNPSDALPLWQGVHAHVGRGPLSLRDSKGQVVTVASVAQLRITAQVAAVWDALKLAYRSGELLAWLGVMAPELERPDLPRPPQDEDAELNALLWSLGHTGLVMEWGDQDYAVSAPADLVRAYQSSWQRLESQLARGHVLAWLDRFHGTASLVQNAQGEKGFTLSALLAGLRQESGRLPAGFAALKLATLCGLRYLPLDPCRPGDDATFRGYTAPAPQRTSDPRAWEPLRGHVTHGTALVWLAVQPGVPASIARPLLQAAFSPWNPGADMVEHGARILVQLAKTFGPPQPSPVLQSELDGAVGRVAVHPSGAIAKSGAAPKRRAGLAKVLLGLSLLVASAAGAFALWDRAQEVEPPQPWAAPGAEVWVRLTVRVRADATDNGRAWDPLDGTLPDLRARVHVRDEVIAVGPCVDARECVQSWDRVRLVPNVPFRVRVDDMEGPFENALGAVWMRWRGESSETLRTRVGATAVEVRIQRESVQTASPSPTAPTIVAPTARPVATPTAPATQRTRATSRTRRRDAGPRRDPDKIEQSPMIELPL